jgi:DNA-directed RNA polymerase specialized sigma24 family protein
MRKKNKIREEASIKSMLYSINRNVWLSELRRRKNRSQRDMLFESEKEIEIADYSQELIKMEGYKMIMGLFEKLGKRCKAILTLFYFDNLSMEEIVKKEQFSSEQVLRNKKYKCMKALTSKVESNKALYEKSKISPESWNTVKMRKCLWITWMVIWKLREYRCWKTAFCGRPN